MASLESALAATTRSRQLEFEKHTELSAEEIVREALTVAGEIDIYTNTNIVVEKIDLSV